MIRIAMVLAGLLVLTAGCAVGPDYERPRVTDLPDGYAEAAAIPVAETIAVEMPTDWWTDFGSPELDALVEEALTNSPDVAAAAARVMAARGRLESSNASRLPSVEVGGTGSRSQTTRARFGGMGSFYQNFFTATVDAAYELDLWGRLSRTRRSAWAAALASEADRRTVRQALVADVVRGWLSVHEAQAQLDLARDTVAAYARSQDMVEDRYLSGVAEAVDLHLASQTLSSAEALAALREQELAAVRRGLEVLLGRYPAGDLTAAGPGLDRLPSLPAVPAGLPSTLLERRPDIQAAEMRLRAAVETVGATKAELFPTLAVTGEYGYNSSIFEELLKDASNVWSLAGSVAMPLLNRGATTGRIDSARADAAEAEAGYVKTVLNGFREVESALSAERHQHARRDHLSDGADHARRALALAEDRYRQGLDGYQTVLESQRRLLQADGDRLAAERAWRTARVDLIQALGGDWDEPVAPETDDLSGGQEPTDR